MKLTITTAETAALKAQIRAATDPRDKERLKVVHWVTNGQHTLADFAWLVGGAGHRQRIQARAIHADDQHLLPQCLGSETCSDLSRCLSHSQLAHLCRWTKLPKQ